MTISSLDSPLAEISIVFAGRMKQYEIASSDFVSQIQVRGSKVISTKTRGPIDIEGRDRTRDLGFTILATGISAGIVLMALKSLVGPVLRINAAKVTVETLAPVRGADGSVVLTRAGTPLYSVTRQTTIDSAALDATATGAEMQCDVNGVLQITISSE